VLADERLKQLRGAIRVAKDPAAAYTASKHAGRIEDKRNALLPGRAVTDRAKR
jgi:hypothetical protein